MAIKKLVDMTAIAALAPGSVESRTVTLNGLPSGKRAAQLWIYVEATLSRGVGAAVHQPQAQAEFVSSILGKLGRHTLGVTNGQDLYSGQEIGRGQIYAGNTVLTAGATSWTFRYPIPLTYILGGPGEIATRPPTEELEGQSLTFTFENPYIATDVDDIVTTQLSLYLEYYERGEAAVSIGENLERLTQWGTFLSSRTGITGNKYIISDVVPTLVLLKDRSWTTMTVKANGDDIITQLTPDQMVMADGTRFAKYNPDPILEYGLGAVARTSIPILADIPLAAGGTATWTKLLDLRNDRSAEGPYEFIANSSYSFADRDIVIIGRHAVSGEPTVRI